MDFRWVSVRLAWFFYTFKSVYSGCWNCHRGPEWCSNSRGIFQQAIFLITRAYGGFLSHGYPKSSRPSFWPWPSNLVLKAMVTSGSCHFKYITSFFPRDRLHSDSLDLISMLLGRSEIVAAHVVSKGRESLQPETRITSFLSRLGMATWSSWNQHM